MADVFISYARTERKKAEQIKSAIEGLGLTVFFDVDGLDGGDVFPDVLDREVKNASCVLGLWSPHALSRPWIRTECLIGKDRGVFIPAAIEPVNSLDVPAAFYGVHYNDLTDFTGDLSHPGWIKLVRALARTLRRPGLIEATKPKPLEGTPAIPAKRFAVWIAGVIAAMALVGAWFGWDANWRTKAVYCANVAENYSVPSCVGRLDNRTLKHREVSYRISTRGGQVVELERVNNRGVLRDTNFDYLGEAWASDIARWTYSYRDDGKIASVDASDEYGRTVRELEYDFEPDMGSAVVRSGLGAGRSEMFSGKSASLGQSVRIEGVPEFSSNSSIGQHRLTYDATGRVVRRMFEALGGSANLVDAQGVAGRGYAYSPQGLPNEIRNLGPDGKPDELAGRITMIAATYTDKGDLAGVEWRAANGQLISGPSGSARVSVKRDTVGNGIQERFFDANGAPVFDLIAGYARADYLYGDRGDQAKITYYGTDGKLTHRTTKSRAAIEEATFDAKGRVATLALFDIDGQPFLSRQSDTKGAALIRIAYSPAGLPASLSFFDAEGKPTLAGEDCVATHRIDSNARGYPIEHSYFGPDGLRIASCYSGAAIEKIQRDAFDREVQSRYFGVDGKPTISSDGDFGATIIYDERGNVSEIISVGIDGGPTNTSDGAIKRIFYDSRGRVIALKHLDAENRPFMVSEGFFRTQLEYDERGNLTRKAFFGMNGEPTTTRELDRGAHSEEHEYDARGAIVSETYRDVDGNIVGSIGRFRNDERGRHIEASCWTPKNESADCRETPGIHAIRLELDERSNIAKATKLGANEQPIISSGFAIARSEYDLLGQQFRRNYFDIAGRPAVNLTNGCSIEIQDFDDRGNVKELTCRGLNGLPVLSLSTGAAKITTEWDARDRKIGEFTFDVDGQPVVTSAGYAGIRIAYDNLGRKIEERYFGPDGKPMAHARDGHALNLRKYDHFGHLSEVRYIGLDGELSADERSKSAMIRWTNDWRGNATEIRYYDVQEKLQYLDRRIFDANGRLEKAMYYGADEKLNEAETFQYSQSGACLSRRSFDAVGASLGEIRVRDQSECE